MNDKITPAKKKKSVFGKIGIGILTVVIIAGILLYINFNRLLSTALDQSFNSTLVADVYELKFENLRVNVFEGNIKVFNVSLKPREKPLNNYPYINSSFQLTAKEITLESVEIRTLLRFKRLILEKILIREPDVEVLLTARRNIMLPFKDSTATVKPIQEKSKKKALGAFMLNEFQLIDAKFHVTNSYKQRGLEISDFNISLHDLELYQEPHEYFTSFNQITIAIGEFNGDLQNESLQHLGFKDFNIGIDTLSLQLTMDTIMYRFHDLSAGMRDLDIQTADSLFNITMQSFDLSYEKKSIHLKEVSFKPNVSHAELQNRHRYQYTEYSGSVGTLDILAMNFDSLIYAQKLLIDEIVLDQVKAVIFKDKTKPLGPPRAPIYLGQTVTKISLPLQIKQVKATNVHLDNTERKPDSTLAKVSITKATLEIKNITNLPTNTGLVMNADAWINGKANFKAALTFSYEKPQFSFEGKIKEFNLPDLNPLVQDYTPAKINKGVADEISFSGLATETKASGTMKFLYHELEVDLALREQAKWKSSVIAFAANSILNSSNPASEEEPPRVVKFRVERDMSKGFVNVLLKSVLNGLKETMIMSKENRKLHNESKKNAARQN